MQSLCEVVAPPAHSSDCRIRVIYPSHLSESSIRVIYPSHLSEPYGGSPLRPPASESSIRVICPGHTVAVRLGHLYPGPWPCAHLPVERVSDWARRMEWVSVCVSLIECVRVCVCTYNG